MPARDDHDRILILEEQCRRLERSNRRGALLLLGLSGVGIGVLVLGAMNPSGPALPENVHFSGSVTVKHNLTIGGTGGVGIADLHLRVD